MILRHAGPSFVFEKVSSEISLVGLKRRSCIVNGCPRHRSRKMISKNLRALKKTVLQREINSFGERKRKVCEE